MHATFYLIANVLYLTNTNRCGAILQLRSAYLAIVLGEKTQEEEEVLIWQVLFFLINFWQVLL